MLVPATTPSALAPPPPCCASCRRRCPATLLDRRQPGGRRPVELRRAGLEAELAVNVAEGAPEQPILAFEDTGTYKLLLGQDPDELQRFYDETVATLVAYDSQYETELVGTVEAFLDADGNVAATSQRLFTHRHTVRYRLDRVRELTGARRRLQRRPREASLGLKAMRVLGIAPPAGPASEAGTEAGRVPRR